MVSDELFQRAEPSGFAILRRTGTVERLVTKLPVASRRLCCIMTPSDSSVVLGSAQSESDLDAFSCADHGYGITRRHSGGGAVVIDPGSVVWIDLFVPSHDPLWERDVAVASHWVGDLWSRELSKLDAGGLVPSTHRGPMVKSLWSGQCCFAGLGPGEVTLGPRKVVGLSQRRTRSGTWFFTMAYVAGEPRAAADLFALDDESRDDLRRTIDSSVVTLGVPGPEVMRMVLDSLELIVF